MVFENPYSGIKPKAEKNLGKKSPNSRDTSRLKNKYAT